MGVAVRRRIEALEARRGLGPKDRERREREARREILRRMTDEELDIYEEAARRFEAAGQIEERDRPILRRVEELLEEVRGGAAADLKGRPGARASPRGRTQVNAGSTGRIDS